MRILFLSRAYPPIMGGIENQNYGIAHALSDIADVRILANTRGKKFLPLFLPCALIQVLFLMRNYDALIIGDGVLAPLARAVKIFFPQKKFISIIHGLDITYAHKPSLAGKLYRLLNIPAMKQLDKLIMVGNYTIDEAVKVGIPRPLCTFIPNGYDAASFQKSYTKDALAVYLGIDLRGKKVIARIGRFVTHKGVPWFIAHVMPLLPDDYLFVAAGSRIGITFGDHDAYTEAEDAIKKYGLENRVILRTNLSWDDAKLLYGTADLYVSPNIHVGGSAEGFGINAIEAAASGTTVLASDYQGLKDAIHEGKNGFLIEKENAELWVEKILELTSEQFDRSEFGRQASNYTEEYFAWEKIAQAYLRALEEIND